jgi:hypothetical protein
VAFLQPVKTISAIASKINVLNTVTVDLLQLAPAGYCRQVRRWF